MFIKLVPHSNTRLLASGSALRVTRLVTQVVVAFFLTPFIIHSLGDRMYGFWALVASFIGYYGLLDLGLGKAVSRYVAGSIGKREPEECEKLFSTALQLYSALGGAVIAITLAIALLSPYFARSPQDAALFSKLILILGFNVGIGFAVRAFGGLLEAELRLDALAVIEILTLLLRSALVVVVLLAGYKLLALAWVTFFSGFPGMAATIVMARRQCPWLRFRLQPWLGKRTRNFFSYGAFALVAQLSDQLRTNTNSFVIAGFIGLVAVTHFRIAWLMAGYFTSLMVAFMGTIGPWFSRKDGAGDYASIRKMLMFSTRLSLCAAGFIGFGFVAWGKPFIQRWMGAAYLDAYPCLAVLAIGRIASCGQMPSVSFLYGVAKHKFYAVMNLGEGIANLALSLWLVRPLGIFGVALGTFIPMVLVRLVVQPLYVCHVSPIAYREYMRELGRSGLIVAAGLLVPSLISARFAAPSYTRLVPLALACFVCYVLVVGALGWSRQERATLLRAVLPRPIRARYQEILS